MEHQVNALTGSMWYTCNMYHMLPGSVKEGLRWTVVFHAHSVHPINHHPCWRSILSAQHEWHGYGFARLTIACASLGPSQKCCAETYA